MTAFDVIAEPRRREILDLLAQGELPVGELVRRLKVSQPAVSKHLRVLRDAGLVSSRIDAQRRQYRLEPGPLAEIDTWLAPYRAFWTRRLDRLEAHLDKGPAEGRAAFSVSASRLRPGDKMRSRKEERRGRRKP